MMPYYGIPMDVTGENVGMGYNKEILTGLLREKMGVVFGRFAPTGKLPFELPCSMEAVKRQKEDVPYDSDPIFAQN